MRNRLVLITLGLLLIAGEVSAQEGLRDRDRTFAASQQISSDLRRARFRSGPFFLLSSIELSDIGYDSSFFVPTTEQGSGISFGLSAPQRLYYVPTKKTVFTVEAVPQYTFFGTVKGSNRRTGQFGYTTRADAQFLLNHLYLDFYGNFSDALVPYVGEVDRLVTRRQYGTGIAGEIKYTSKTSATFQAGYRGTKFPTGRYQPVDVPIELLNRIEQTYRVGLVHKTFPLTSLHIAAERSNYQFERSFSKNSHRIYYGAGFAFSNGRTGLRFEAGPGKLEFKDPTQKRFTGVLGSAQFSRKGALWSFGTTVNRDLEFALTPLNNYYIIDQATMLLEYTVTRRLTLRFSETAGRDRYDVPAPTSLGVFVLRRDTMNFAAVGWLYQLHRLRGGFDIGYYKRTSNFNIATQNGIRGILHLSFTP